MPSMPSLAADAQVNDIQAFTDNPPRVISTSVSQNGRCYKQQASAALVRTWEIIKEIANFVFNIVLGGLFYRLPKAILYDLPCLLSKTQEGIDNLNRLAPVTDALVDMAKQWNNPLNRQVASDLRGVVGAAVGAPSRNTRANLALAVHDLARYAASSAPEDLGKLRGAALQVAERVDAAKGMSLYQLITKTPAKPHHHAEALIGSSMPRRPSSASGASQVEESPTTPHDHTPTSTKGLGNTVKAAFERVFTPSGKQGVTPRPDTGTVSSVPAVPHSPTKFAGQ